jgi:hypothetical protein
MLSPSRTSLAELPCRTRSDSASEHLAQASHQNQHQVEELSFVSISRCHSGLASRRFLLPFVSLAFAGFGFSATAQTAPQLLPYTVKLIAGSGTATIASGATCPASGFRSTDAYGDGCLATEIMLTGPRYAIADANGNIFFSDYTNGLVRRVDAVTGIVTAVAGGAATSPASGTACGSYQSTDARGDGCLATAVHLSHPVGLVFSPAGDLYFGDSGYANVRKVAATAGVLPVTSGVISLVAGSVAGTYGYTSNNSSGNIVAATGSYLDAPFGLAFDSNGNLYIADEYKNAVVVVNTNATTTTTVTGVSIPPGTVAKIIGASTTGGSTCPNSPATTNGCNYGTFTPGAVANASLTDAPYGVAFDPSGNVYFTNEYLNSVAKVVPSGTISIYAGTEVSAGGKVLQRAQAGSFAFGSDFGIAADTNSNIYVTDALNGVIWRIEGTTKSMYVVAGGALSTCGAAADTYGDGCPATQSTFGKSGTTYASTGVYGVSVDAYSDLFVGDTITNIVREVSSGVQFGNVGATQTNTLDIHFAANDSAATGGYTLTSGASIFSLGTISCTTNIDLTTDCLLPVTAAPSVLGPFTGTLQVQSQLNGIATFPLTGNFVQSPVTRTVASAAGPATCTGSTIYSTTAATTLTAYLVANGPSNPSGSIVFYANGTALAPTSGVAVGNIGTAGAPVYGATLSYTFSTPGTYTITATYSGDSYFKTSTSAATASVTTALPAFAASAITYQQNTVSAGQTALYSFNLAQTVYTGTITFSASGLPANSSVSFSPSTITASGCSTSNTVALSILTQQGPSALQSSIGLGGKGLLGSLTTLLGLGLALFIGLRRRRAPLRYGHFWMALALLLAASGTVACNNSVTAIAGTPSGPYTITVTATGSTGTVSSFTIPLTVR